MLIRVLPLVAGIAPFIGISLAYWLAIENAVLPECMPPLDGCVSISATGRYMPASLLFRAVMLPQSVVLVFVWYFAARWLQSLEPASKSTRLIIVAGIVGAAALILYVTFLGTKGPVYEFMRRFGIYLYFLGTASAQLALAVALLRHARHHDVQRLKRTALAMLWLCGLPFALGILNLVLKSALDNADFSENRIEWIAGILMQAYFVVTYFAWRQTGFSVSVETR
ncbi:MAG: hypothetical protein ACR2RD_10865 [Woeseiaceae bacterium]